MHRLLTPWGWGTTSAAGRSDFSAKRAVLYNRMRQATVPAPAWTNVWEAMVPALMTGLGLRHADRQACAGLRGYQWIRSSRSTWYLSRRVRSTSRI
jgi:hypothetical protein